MDRVFIGDYYNMMTMDLKCDFIKLINPLVKKIL